MKISEIMTEEVEVVNPTATLFDVAKKMDELNVGAIPVCDGERLQGMVTDRDIVVKAIAKDMDVRSTKVSEVASTDVFYCFEDQDVEEAADLMEEKQVRRLPILNAQKRLVGIVSLGDIATASGDTNLAGETISEVSTPSRPAH